MIFKTKYSQLYDRKRNPDVISAINVTPFVDVMLVLLVIFMISAPLLVKGVNINLPENGSAPPLDSNNPFTLSISDEGKIYYEKKEILFIELQKFITSNLLSQNSRIYIRGDQSINYGRIMQVISAINEAGYKKVSLVTEPESK